MKCPECGQWNRASMPHCTKCGAPLNIDEASKLQWKDTLKDGGPSTAYLRADEFGQVNSTPDARDQLAGEMQELKKRKREGEERKSRLIGKKRERPDSEVVVTEEPAPASRPRRARHDDMPMTAVRVQPASRNDERRRQESEIWHRVRFMDENGAFADVVKLNDYGYVAAGENCLPESSIPGVFVAGDCRTKSIRQVTTATADGAVAALAACRYLDTL